MRIRMVDITLKEPTVRTAVATGRLFMLAETMKRLRRGSLPKGDALAAAQVAGVQAAKRTHELIPMCHPLMLTSVELEFKFEPKSKSNSRSDGLSAVKITAGVKTTGRTGVEMEALTAVTVAALTIYDMCKAVDRGMMIGEIALLSKTGGRSGEYHRGLRRPLHRRSRMEPPPLARFRSLGRSPRTVQVRRRKQDGHA